MEGLLNLNQLQISNIQMKVCYNYKVLILPNNCSAHESLEQLVDLTYIEAHLTLPEMKIRF